MKIWNCLVDGFPTEYKGYKMRTDWRIGVLLSMLMSDEGVDSDYRLPVALHTLYEEVPKDVNIAVEGLEWFMTSGRSEVCYADGYTPPASPEKCIDFQQDSLDIYGAFMAHGIELEKTEMHWFKFMAMLTNLGDCPITQKIGMRSMDISKLKGEQRKQYAEMKERYRVRQLVTREEYKEIVDAMSEQYGSYYAKLMAAQSY